MFWQMVSSTQVVCMEDVNILYYTTAINCCMNKNKDTLKRLCSELVSVLAGKLFLKRKSHTKYNKRLLK